MNNTHTSPPSYARSHWEANIRADYRLKGNAELAADEEAMSYAVAAADAMSEADRAVVLDRDGFRLRAIKEERSHRAALRMHHPHVADPYASEYEEWKSLARDIREQVDIVDLLQLAGCHLVRSGNQWVGPCPYCAGRDRFVVWDREASERPRFWCRRCHFAGDAITVYRELMVPGASFREATGLLALQLGLQIPDYGVNQPRRIELAARVSLGELRHAN